MTNQWLWRVTQAKASSSYEGILMGFARKGSNPFVSNSFFCFLHLFAPHDPTRDRPNKETRASRLAQWDVQRKPAVCRRQGWQTFSIMEAWLRLH